MTRRPFTWHPEAHLIDIDLCIVLNVRKDGWVDVGPLSITTNDDLATLLQASLDEPSDVLALRLISDGAEEGVDVRWVALLLCPAGVVAFEVLNKNGSNAFLHVETGVGLRRTKVIDINQKRRMRHEKGRCIRERE
jgi:hypothetical protein